MRGAVKTDASGSLDVDALIEKIRAEALTLSPSLPEPVVLESAAAPARSTAPPEDPLAAIPHKRSCHIDDLLLYDGEDFVDVAYRALLHREADAGGMQTYLGKMRAGDTKAQVLYALRYSSEGRSIGVTIGGAGLLLWGCRLHAALSRLRLGRFSRFALRKCVGMYERRIGPLREVSLLWLRSQRKANQSIESLTLAVAENAEVSRRALAELEKDIADWRQAHSEVQAAQGAELQQLRENLQLQRRDLLSQQARVAQLLEQGSGGTVRAPGAEAATQHAHPGAGADPRIAAYYAAFEDSFRGSAEQIRDKLAVYLPRFAPYREMSATHPVLDVGSGRGEWLALLAENGIGAYGVDMNDLSVAECTQHGLKAVHADMLAHLRSLPEQSLSAITGFHIVEHLPFEVLFGLFDEAQRTLAEGGLILFETPNPENVVVASHAFYNDFSHRNPVTPTAIGFLARYHNFERVEIMRLHPYPQEQRLPGSDAISELLNYHFCGPQDFALLAYKPHPGSGE